MLVLALVEAAEPLGELLHLQEHGGDAAVVGVLTGPPPSPRELVSARAGRHWPTRDLVPVSGTAGGWEPAPAGSQPDGTAPVMGGDTAGVAAGMGSGWPRSFLYSRSLQICRHLAHDGRPVAPDHQRALARAAADHGRVHHRVLRVVFLAAFLHRHALPQASLRSLRTFGSLMPGSTIWLPTVSITICAPSSPQRLRSWATP